MFFVCKKKDKIAVFILKTSKIFLIFSVKFSLYALKFLSDSLEPEIHAVLNLKRSVDVFPPFGFLWEQRRPSSILIGWAISQSKIASRWQESNKITRYSPNSRTISTTHFRPFVFIMGFQKYRKIWVRRFTENESLANEKRLCG